MELNEFRNDTNFLIDNILVMNKKINTTQIAKHENSSSSNKMETNLSNLSDNNDSTKLNKLALNIFEKLRNDFETILLKINEPKEDSKNKNELEKVVSNNENLVLITKFVDELNEQFNKWDQTLKLSNSIQLVNENNVLLQNSLTENSIQPNYELNVTNLSFSLF